MTIPLRVLRLSLLIAAVDLAVSFVYWGMQGSGPTRVLGSIAGWVFSTEALALPVLCVLGVLVLCAIHVAMVGALALLLALRPVSPARWLPAGVLYGIVAYVVCYQWLVPALIWPRQLSASPVWIAACLVLHAGCFGPWMVWALMSGAPASQRSRAGLDARGRGGTRFSLR